MKTTERFNNAYHALVDAFYKNNLEYWNYAACAVGSIVARANGYSTNGDRYVCNGKEIFPAWKELFADGIWYLNENLQHGDIKSVTMGRQEIKPTGYTAKELYRIECFFKKQSMKTGENTFETLCALVDFLLKLDGMEPLKSLHEGFKVGKEKAHEILQP